MELVRLISWCQNEQGGRPVIYLLENVDVRADAPTLVKRADIQIRSFLGKPSIRIDAATLGGLSHRFRRFWTNLAAPNQLQRWVPLDHPLADLTMVLEE